MKTKLKRNIIPQYKSIVNFFLEYDTIGSPCLKKKVLISN